jgi:hypothetical protein
MTGSMGFRVFWKRRRAAYEPPYGIPLSDTCAEALEASGED